MEYLSSTNEIVVTVDHQGQHLQIWASMDIEPVVGGTQRISQM